MKNGKITNVLVVASLPIIAAGIEAAIAKIPGFKILSKVKSLEAGIELAATQVPDLMFGFRTGKASHIHGADTHRRVGSTRRVVLHSPDP
jgi:DNA-binding NarL/FixJ family response regulator